MKTWIFENSNFLLDWHNEAVVSRQVKTNNKFNIRTWTKSTTQAICVVSLVFLTFAQFIKSMDINTKYS